MATEVQMKKDKLGEMIEATVEQKLLELLGDQHGRMTELHPAKLLDPMTIGL